MLRYSKIEIKYRGKIENIYTVVHRPYRVHEFMQSITLPEPILHLLRGRRRGNPGHGVIISSPSRAASPRGVVAPAPVSSAAGSHRRRSRGSRVLPGEALHDVLEAGLVSSHLRRDDVLHLHVLLPRRRASSSVRRGTLPLGR
jgi:hypothetical protein